MKKEYIYTRVNLLIALLSFQTFSSCVRTQAFSSCANTGEIYNIGYANGGQRVGRSSPSTTPVRARVAIGTIALFVFGVTALYYFANSVFVSNIIGSDGNSSIPDRPHISMRSISNERLDNISGMFTDKLDEYETTLDSALDNSLPIPRSNNSLLTSAWMKALLGLNTNSSNNFITP